MKIGVVGLGSMGKRRVRDLTAIGHAVTGFDLREDRRAQAAQMFGIPTVESFEALTAAGVQAIVISTPPDVHVSCYELCYRHRLPYFSEANIFTPAAGWFAARESSSGVRGYPSATWRFHPLVRELAERLQKAPVGDVNSVSHQYAGYLPDWHPWERYTDFYAGRRRTSAAREMVPFELEILVAACGPVARVQALKTRARRWDADFDDTYLMILQFAGGAVGSLAVELHHVLPVRATRVSLREEELLLDMGNQTLTVFTKVSESSRAIRPAPLLQNWGFAFEHVYHEEIRQFVAALSGAHYPKSWAEDRHLSDVLYAAELSSSAGRAVEIREVEAAYDGISWAHD